MIILPPVERLSLTGRVEAIETINCKVWRGRGKNPEGKLVGIFVKHATPIQLFADIVGSRLCRGLGLPSPEPFLVKASRQQLGSPSDWRWTTNTGLVFGVSALRGAEAFSRFIQHDEALAQQKLASWSHFWEAGWFDEWIGNIDRNLGNILVAEPGKYWLIDHEQAFGGPTWRLFGPEPTARLRNILLEVGGTNNRIEGRRKYDQIAKRLSQIAADQAIRDIPFLTSAEHDMIAEYLNARIECMPELVCHRLQDDQAEFPLTSQGFQPTRH